MKLDLYSEPFSKNGNLAGEGVKKLLGRPSLNVLQTLIRESLQNVIDATLPGSPPQAKIRLRRLTDPERAALSSSILSQLPVGGTSPSRIRLSEGKDQLWALEIADFGTVGLSGPTEADVPPSDQEKANFVNFLKNVGSARDSHQGGGTYGYGKSSLYAMSSCSMVIVDSQTFDRGEPVRRLMGCHLGEAFDVTLEAYGPRRFTGRHWWGATTVNDSVAPETGDRAIALSTAIGMFKRGVNDTGTTILILDPELDFSQLDETAREIVTCVLVNFWPRMMQKTAASKRLNVSLEIDGKDVDLPNPEAFPPLDLYCTALSELHEGHSVLPVSSQRPPKRLGSLTFTPGLKAERHSMCYMDGPEVLLRSSHIAVMRPVELIVKYIRGAAYADERLEWAGVFVCSDDQEVEEAFAQAEPPTHDDWTPDHLPKGPQQTMVRVGLRELKRQADSFVPSKSLLRSEGNGGPSLAATAGQMGMFLGPVTSRGAAKPTRGSKTPPSTRKGVRISAMEVMGLSVAEDGSPIASFRAQLINDGSRGDIQLRLEPKLVVDGAGIEVAGVPLRMIPKVHSFNLAAHGITSSTSVLAVGRLEGEVTASVRLVNDAAITASIQIVAGDI